MRLYLVRHAKAGSRDGWDGDDDLRPLSKAGRRQAAALVDELAGAGVARIVSSPAVRCRQTVEPLAERLRLPVDLSDAVAEGAPRAESLALVDKLGDGGVCCTHGDVVGNLLLECERQGVPVGEGLMEKGGVWVLDLDAGAFVGARYVPPPAG